MPAKKERDTINDMPSEPSRRSGSDGGDAPDGIAAFAVLVLHI